MLFLLRIAVLHSTEGMTEMKRYCIALPLTSVQNGQWCHVLWSDKGLRSHRAFQLLRLYDLMWSKDFSLPKGFTVTVALYEYRSARRRNSLFISTAIIQHLSWKTCKYRMCANEHIIRKYNPYKPSLNFYQYLNIYINDLTFKY